MITYKKLIALLFILVILSLMAVSPPVFAQQGSLLIIHSVDALANPDGQTYDVSVHLSVLDAKNQSIPNLTQDAFVIKENAMDIILDSIETSTNLPISVIILMDVSATMSGRVRSASEAISQFIGSLRDGNQVAVFAFGEQTSPIVVLTDDLLKAKETFDAARIVAEGASCLKDAALQAAQLAGTLPPGRRAVVLVTDIWDVTASVDACSFTTLDDVIAIASQGQNAVPFYPVGVGANVDEDSLGRLAARTGGLYLFTPDNQALPDILSRIHQTLSSEYVLSYTSTAAPGTQTISVQYQDLVQTINVVLAPLPPALSFNYPTNDEYIKPEVVEVSLNIMERGIPFDTLTFKIDGVAIGTGGSSDQKPYRYPIDFSQYADRTVTLTCILFDESGKQLSTHAIVLNVLAVGVEAPPPTVETSEIVSSTNDIFLGLDSKELIILGAVILAGIAVVVLALIMARRRKGKPAEGKKTDIKEGPSGDATLDGFSLSGLTSGSLTVLSSDDPAMIGKEYVLAKTDFSIGRSVENDLAFPKDSAVSRRHIVLFERNSDFYLREEMKMMPDGTKAPPTYGTYINDRKISGEVLLHSGDEIGLGRRTKLRFVSYGGRTSPDSSEDMTFDGLITPDQVQNDATMDG